MSYDLHNKIQPNGTVKENRHIINIEIDEEKKCWYWKNKNRKKKKIYCIVKWTSANEEKEEGKKKKMTKYRQKFPWNECTMWETRGDRQNVKNKMKT